MIVATAKLRLAMLLAAALTLTMLTLLVALALLVLALLPATLIVLMTTLLLVLFLIVLRLALAVRVLALALLTIALLLIVVVLVVGIVGHDVLLVAGSRLNVFGGSRFRFNVAETPPQRSTCANLSREGSEGLRLHLTEGFVSGPAGPIPGPALPP